MTDLVIPAVHARPDLDAALEVIRAAQEVVAQLGQILRGRVVQAHDEERVVNNLEARLVVLVRNERSPEARPDPAVFRR